MKPARARRPVEDLESLLDNICGQVDCGLIPSAKDQVTIRELLATVGRRSYGPLLLIIGLFSISPATIVPGMTWLSAGMTLVIALQMLVGRRTPWLPRRALDASDSRDLVVKGVSGFRPWARRIDAMMRPRLTFLANPPFVSFIALACAVTALVTIPLGLIPFAPLAPGIAIVMFGLGMTARDGLLLAFALLVVGGACYFTWPILEPLAMPVVHLVEGWMR